MSPREVEAAEEIAERLLARSRIDALQVRERCLVGAQHFERVLREVADA